MNTIVIIVLLSGWSSQYDPGVFERVIRNRQSWGQLPASPPVVDGYVAVEDCSRVGEFIYLKPARQGKWEKFWIVDCAAPPAREWMKRNNILVEVDSKTVKRWGYPRGRGIPVEVGKKIRERCKE